MAEYDHLRLVRLPERFERRKRPGFGGAPTRDRSAHGADLSKQIEDVITDRRRARAVGVDPSLILRVRLSSPVTDDEWERAGLTVLSGDADKTLVLFANDDELKAFRARVTSYAGDIPEGQKAAPYSNFVGAIDGVEAVTPADRIGRRLREHGYARPSDFQLEASYMLDMELWDLGDRKLRSAKLDAIEKYVAAAGGEIVDRYIGPSITLARIRARGRTIVDLLDVPEVATIDQPPRLDVEVGDLFDMPLADIPTPGPVDPRGPIIGVVDSGVNEHPLLAGAILGAIGCPEGSRSDDEQGHGTRVAGVAMFGDLRAQLERGALDRPFRICSARVVNAQGGFDERRLVPTLMRDAVGRLHELYGCRLFVIPLADSELVYEGGKVGSWAATIDEIARELDVLIIIPAGNRMPRNGEDLEEAVTRYPHYLVEPENRLFEPAGAINVVTVGSLAHGDGLDASHGEDAKVRPIASALEPSPFTRVGAGPQGATKPDFVDVGGTLVFDPVVRRLLRGQELASAGVLTLHNVPSDRLFASGSGTSYSAPRVAYKAGHVLKRFPEASSNLLRTLLALSAEIPEEAAERLAPLGAEATRTICGHGCPDALRAATSDDPRVVLYTEDDLPIDHFAIYEVPVPKPFQTEPGARHIAVALAFDPPVRHTRTDYAGVGMSFRLIRGCDPQLLFDHYRKRSSTEARFPEIEQRHQCALKPGPQIRDSGALQVARVSFARGVEKYGDVYHLVVRCEGGWAAASVLRQRFAVAVEIGHQRPIQLYARVRERLRA